jgi:hypothetical protein
MWESWDGNIGAQSSPDTKVGRTMMNPPQRRMQRLDSSKDAGINNLTIGMEKIA